MTDRETAAPGPAQNGSQTSPGSEGLRKRRPILQNGGPRAGRTTSGGPKGGGGKGARLEEGADDGSGRKIGGSGGVVSPDSVDGDDNSSGGESSSSTGSAESDSSSTTGSEAESQCEDPNAPHGSSTRLTYRPFLVMALEPFKKLQIAAQSDEHKRQLQKLEKWAKKYPAHSGATVGGGPSSSRTTSGQTRGAASSATVSEKAGNPNAASLAKEAEQMTEADRETLRFYEAYEVRKALLYKIVLASLIRRSASLNLYFFDALAVTEEEDVWSFLLENNELPPAFDLKTSIRHLELRVTDFGKSFVGVCFRHAEVRDRGEEGTTANNAGTENPRQAGEGGGPKMDEDRAQGNSTATDPSEKSAPIIVRPRKGQSIENSDGYKLEALHRYRSIPGVCNCQSLDISIFRSPSY